MENTPPEAIYTPLPSRLPSGNLEGLGVQIASWGVFSNIPRLSAVYYYSARAGLFILEEKLMTSCSDEEDWDGRAAANSSLVTLPIQL